MHFNAHIKVYVRFKEKKDAVSACSINDLHICDSGAVQRCHTLPVGPSPHPQPHPLSSPVLPSYRTAPSLTLPSCRTCRVQCRVGRGSTQMSTHTALASTGIMSPMWWSGGKKIVCLFLNLNKYFLMAFFSGL